MEQTWRWYGPEDPVTLADIRQAGATGIVTALHHIANGEVWSRAEILERKKSIEKAGLRWSVVESIPVHEEIKTHSGHYQQWTTNYQQSLRNLAACNICTVCYNFMPLLDWTRTDLAWELPDGARTLRFDQVALAIFDCWLLKRIGAEADYSSDELHEAKTRYNNMNSADKQQLITNIIAGLPGAEEGYTLEQFHQQLKRYEQIDEVKLRENLGWFLRQVIPVAENAGVKMAVHPDDPPRSLLGLPRIVSTVEDMRWIAQIVDSPANGFTFCTGCYGVREENDLVAMVREFADRIWFAHLRSTQREKNSQSFYEAAHLAGDVDMYGVMKALITEEQRRAAFGTPSPIPMRPDHGHQMLDDLRKKINPGYSAIGRLRGLAELRGLEMGILRSLQPNIKAPS